MAMPEEHAVEGSALDQLEAEIHTLIRRNEELSEQVRQLRAHADKAAAIDAERMHKMIADIRQSQVEGATKNVFTGISVMGGRSY